MVPAAQFQRTIVQRNFSNALSPEEMKQLEVVKFRGENSVKIVGGKPYNPIFSFDEAPFSDTVKSILQKSFEKPSLIQSEVWGAMGSQDVIGVSKTGSGKTLAYLLPSLRPAPPARRPRPHTLILVPTRELCMQVAQEAARFLRPHHLASFYGGASRGNQLRDYVRHGAEVVVATPGRLIDFLESAQVDLSTVGTLVLDEADRMLEMGFEEQVWAILERVPEARRTALFSATWPPEVAALAARFLTHPVEIRVDTKLTVPKEITQIVRVSHAGLADVIKILETEFPQCKALVFVGTQMGTEALVNDLLDRGISASAIHGGMTQSARTDAIRTFRTTRPHVLVATDLASRGISIPDIDLVINLGFPQDQDSYVHRIGRTGRAGASGTAITLLTKTPPKSDATFLLNLLAQGQQKIPPETKTYLEKAAGMSGSNMSQSSRFRDPNSAAPKGWKQSYGGSRSASRGNFGDQSSGYGNRDSGFGNRESGFGNRDSGFGNRDRQSSGFGDRGREGGRGRNDNNGGSRRDDGPIFGQKSGRGGSWWKE